MIVVTRGVLRSILPPGREREPGKRGRPADTSGLPLAQRYRNYHQASIQRHKDDSRTLEMEALYRSGQTLEQVGQKYGVTRERVRQLISARGVTRLDGGKAVERFLRTHDIIAKEKAYLEDRDRRCYEKKGMSLERWKEHVAQWGNGKGSPFVVFTVQRSNYRPVWELSFADWWALWEESGKWAEHGRGFGYQMIRYGGSGLYKLGNVFITTGDERARHSYLTTTAAERTVKREKTQKLARDYIKTRNAEIMRLRAKPTSVAKLARKFGLSKHSIYAICERGTTNAVSK